MTTNDIKQIKEALKPFINSGLVKESAMKEIEAMKIDGKPVENKLLTRKQVMESLSVSLQTLINWERLGKLKAVKLAGVHLVRYKQSDIDELCSYKQ
ncbi:MAG: helix-turn-helix domain-containing protein [Victivallales bacterium]